MGFLSFRLLRMLLIPVSAGLCFAIVMGSQSLLGEGHLDIAPAVAAMAGITGDLAYAASS